MIKAGISQGSQRGVAALTTILGIGLSIAVLGFALGALAFLESSMGFAQSKSQEAYLVAQSGVADAFMRLARNKTFSSAGYTLGIGNGTSTVVVAAHTPVIGQNTITATGEVSKRKRKLEVKVAVDNTSGQITVVSWKELPL